MRQSFFRFARRACWLLLLAGLVVTRPWELLPSEWKPWAPLRLDHPPTAITRAKLSRLQQQPEACLDILASAPAGALDYLPLADYTPVESCPLTNVVRVNDTAIDFSSPFTLSCPLLVRWLMFEQQALQTIAMEHYGSPVNRIEHLGSFACRNVYGRETGRRSQHATASAFDVAEFGFANGERANVLEDWDAKGGTKSSAFLHEAHDAACQYFGTVLGPDYNQPHANHFHLDTSSFDLCR